MKSRGEVRFGAVVFLLELASLPSRTHWFASEAVMYAFRCNMSWFLIIPLMVRVFLESWEERSEGPSPRKF